MSFPAARPGGGTPSTAGPGAATAAAQHGGAGASGPAAKPQGSAGAKPHQIGDRPLAARSRFSVAGHTPLGSPAANSAASWGSPAAAAAAACSGGSSRSGGSSAAAGGVMTADGMLRGSAVLRQGAAQIEAGQVTMSGGYLRAAEPATGVDAAASVAPAAATARDRRNYHGDENATPVGSSSARAAARRLLAPLQGRRGGWADAKGRQAGSVRAVPDASRSSSRPGSPLAAAESPTQGGSAHGGSIDRSSAIASTPGRGGISSGGPHSPPASTDGGAHGARGVSSPAARAASPVPLSPDGSVRSGGSGAGPSSPVAAATAAGPRAGGEATAPAAEAAPALPPAHAGEPPRPAAGVTNGSGRSLGGPDSPPKPGPGRRDGGGFNSGRRSAAGSAAAANATVDGRAAAPAPADDRGGWQNSDSSDAGSGCCCTVGCMGGSSAQAGTRRLPSRLSAHSHYSHS